MDEIFQNLTLWCDKLFLDSVTTVLIQQNPNPIMEYDRNGGSLAHNANRNYRFHDF